MFVNFLNISHISMALLAHVDFLSPDFKTVFDCKIFQADLERSLIEIGHFDIAQILAKKCGVNDVFRLQGSEVVRKRIVEHLINKLMRKGLISYTYQQHKASCFFMDITYYTPASLTPSVKC